MLSYLGGFKGLVQFKACLIDNTTFRLHYQGRHIDIDGKEERQGQLEVKRLTLH